MADLRPSRQSWDKKAIHEWALSDFPDAFRAVVHPTGLDFVDVDYAKMKRSRFELSINAPSKLLVIGLYDDGSDPKDKVFAFVHGNHFNQVSYMVERAKQGRYCKLASSDLGRVDVEEPFCNITDGSERTCTTTSRLRALICYFFLASGYIEYFGGYEAFVREFRKACLWIANGGGKPDDLMPKSRQRYPTLRPLAIPSDTRKSLRDETVLVKSERLVGIRSDDDLVEALQGEWNVPS